MRAAGDMQERASLRPPFGFSGKKISASKAGSILPYYGGGDNARKKFAGGEILSHTMIFFLQWGKIFGTWNIDGWGPGR